MNKHFSRFVFPGVIGNVLEWYDFSLYIYFATVLAKQFFPVENSASLYLTYGIFALGQIVRPVGAVIAGHFGDCYGRKKVLLITVLIMSIVTTLMGLLPTYHSIGISAGIALTCCRLLQGLACGGQFSGSMVYMAEQSNPTTRGFWGSTTLMSAYLGMMLSSLIGMLTLKFANYFPNADWAWRIPFLLGSVLGILGIYLRAHMHETPIFKQLTADKKVVNPLKFSLKTRSKVLLFAICIAAFPACCSYYTTTFFPNYLVSYLNYPLESALYINTCAMLLAIIFIPLSGFLSDHFGRKKLILVSCYLMGIIMFPLFKLIAPHAFWKIFLTQATLMACGFIAEAILPTILNELFDTEIRFTSMAMVYNVAQGLFGGTVPLISTFLINQTSNQLSPLMYLLITIILAIIALSKIPETKGLVLQ